MSYSVLALFVVVVIQAIAAYFSFRENRKLQHQLTRLRKLNSTILECNGKNEEFIQQVIKTNQAQAKKIRELKNRIEF